MPAKPGVQASEIHPTDGKIRRQTYSSFQRFGGCTVEALSGIGGCHQVVQYNPRRVPFDAQLADDNDGIEPSCRHVGVDGWQELQFPIGYRIVDSRCRDDDAFCPG